MSGGQAVAAESGGPPPPGLTVAAVAHRLGVAPATLRTWARRYGLGPSAHEAGSHRRYTSADIARLVVMRRLTLEGVPPGDAARTARDEPARGAAALSAVPDGGDGDPLREVAAAATLLSRSSPSPVLPVPEAGGRAGRRPSAPPWGQELDRAAVSLDPADAARLVERAFDEHGVLEGWEQLIGPAVRALSQRWETSGPGVDSVLLLTGAVLTALRARPAPWPLTSAVVLLAAASTEHEALVLHVLAAALAERGVPSRVLAPGRPPEALAAAVRSTGPAAVVVVASAPVRDSAQLDLLPRLRPGGRLVLAGRGWDGAELPEGLGAQVVRELAPAVEAVSRRVLA